MPRPTTKLLSPQIIVDAAIRMVEDFRDGVQFPTRWNCNRLLATLERVRGRIEENGR